MYAYNGILSGFKREGNSDAYYNMDACEKWEKRGMDSFSFEGRRVLRMGGGDGYTVM
jgi:hypothetical protein